MNLSNPCSEYLIFIVMLIYIFLLDINKFKKNTEQEQNEVGTNEVSSEENKDIMVEQEG